jgi:hypothetical protein
MEAAIVIGIFLLIGGAITGIVFVSLHFDKKRRESLAGIAEEMGLTFMPEGSDVLWQRLSPFYLFNLGRARKMSNLVQGDAGEVKLAIFDYQYTTGSGKNTHTAKMTIVAMESAELKCPPFSLRPENLFDKLGGMLGFQDIDFASHPKFSSMFVLKSPNEEQVRQFMKPALLEYFESQPGISLEADQGVLFFYRGSRRAKPHELKDLFAQAYAAYGKIVDS